MSKYVEADKLAESLEAIAYSDLRPDSYFSGGFREGLRKAAHMLREEPSADVALVRHGTWKPDFGEYSSPYNTGTVLHCDGLICSLCGCRVSTASAYCPHCGAKMDVETP